MKLAAVGPKAFVNVTGAPKQHFRMRVVPPSLAVTNIHVTLSHAAPARVLQGCLLIVRLHPIVSRNIVLSIPTLALWSNDGTPRELPGAQEASQCRAVAQTRNRGHMLHCLVAYSSLVHLLVHA